MVAFARVIPRQGDNKDRRHPKPRPADGLTPIARAIAEYDRAMHNVRRLLASAGGAA